MPSKISIEKLLVEHDYLAESQLKRIEHFKEQEPDRPVEEILVELGYVTEDDVIACAAFRDGVAAIDLDKYNINEKAAVMVPSIFARHNKVIPIDFEDDKLVLAATYPLDPDIIDEAATITGMEVKPVLASGIAVDRAIRRTYVSEWDMANTAARLPGSADADRRQKELEFKERVESAPVVRMVNAVIEDAYNRNASDIHVEPGKNALVIRIRVNGDLIVHSTLQMEYHRPMVTRLKLMAGMDIAEKRMPQDGKYHYERDDISTDLRISTLPVIYGEKVVLRLLGNDRDNSLMDIKRLGMDEEQLELFEKILCSPHGIVLVTGPTGSGKTTTLYAVINRIVKNKINVVTVEDPVEKMIEGIAQVQVNPKAGLTFALALRSILRQDPDVIMVGEMRDEETVSIGVRAAITGHLVLSTLHTNDCAATINRLRNMGVPSYMVAASLSGIIAQRLVKVLCPYCRESYDPDERESKKIRTLAGREPGKLWRPVGCPKCSGAGFSGRRAIYEMLDVNEMVKDMILSGVSPREIHIYQEQKGLKSLRDYAVLMAFNGETSMEEAEKVIYSAE